MPITETEYIWMNGEFIKWKEARIHVLTHALHYGSGVFDGMRCYKTVRSPAVFRLDDHIRRLYNSARVYHMTIPYSFEELCEAVKKLVRMNSLEECYIRPIAYRGYGEMGLNPLKCPVEVAVAMWPWGLYLGEEGIKYGVKAKISSFQRISTHALPSYAKATGQYLNSILSKVEALSNGYDETIMLDHRGFLSEGSGENIFIVKDDVLNTPSNNSSVLPGITKDSIVTIAKNFGHEVKEIDLSMQMLFKADEAFFTGTASEVVPIREVDGNLIGKGKPGPVTAKLQKEFGEIVRGKRQEYQFWLQYIE